MADNYIGNRMDDYLAGKLASPRRTRLTPSGRRPGKLELEANLSATVWICEGALLPAGLRLIEQLKNAGISVSYRAQGSKEGAAPAIKFGARHFPPEATAPDADHSVSITVARIEIDGGRSLIEFREETARDAADMAAALLSRPGSSILSARITL